MRHPTLHLLLALALLGCADNSGGGSRVDDAEGDVGGSVADGGDADAADSGATPDTASPDTASPDIPPDTAPMVECVTDDDCDDGEVCDDDGACAPDASTCADDALEPNDDRDGAAPLPEGSAEGLALCDNNEDWFLLVAEEGQEIVVEAAFDTGRGDLDLTLYGAAQEPLARSADGASPERLTAAVATSGEHWLRVTWERSAGRLAYDLSLSLGVAEPLCAADPYEPNQRADAAPTLPPGAYDGLTLCGEEDPDFFGVEMEAGETLTARVAFSHADGDLDLRVLAPDGVTTLASSLSADDDEEVTATATTSGVHLLRVYGYEDTRNTYDLTLSVATEGAACHLDPYEPNQSVDAAQTLFPTIYDDLTLCGEDDPDFFGVEMEEGEKLTARIDFSHDVSNLDLSLYAPNGRTLLERSVSNDDFELIEHIATSTGIYVLNVFGYVSLANDYTLSLNVTDGVQPPEGCDDPYEPNDRFIEAAFIQPRTLTEVSLCAESDPDDFFSFEAIDGQAITVEVQYDALASGADIDLWLYEMGGNRAPNVSRDERPGYERLTTITALSGSYTVRAFTDDVDGDPIPYSMTIRVSD